MAAKKEEAAEKAVQEECFDIMELWKKCGTPAAVFTGTCSMMNWYAGKRVTLTEYEKAVERFQEGRVG